MLELNNQTDVTRTKVRQRLDFSTGEIGGFGDPKLDNNRTIVHTADNGMNVSSYKSPLKQTRIPWFNIFSILNGSLPYSLSNDMGNCAGSPGTLAPTSNSTCFSMIEKRLRESLEEMIDVTLEGARGLDVREAAATAAAFTCSAPSEMIARNSVPSSSSDGLDGSLDGSCSITSSIDENIEPSDILVKINRDSDSLRSSPESFERLAERVARSSR